MINRVGQLAVLLIGSLALTVGCSGEKPFTEPPPVSESQPASTAFPTLPPPSQIKFESELVSERLKPGSDFETGLPHQLVTPHVGNAVFDSHWTNENEPAFALYRLSAPGASVQMQIRTFWSEWKYNGYVWMGLADFGIDQWEWRRVNATYLGDDSNWVATTSFFDEIYQVYNHVLVAVVCLDDNSLNSLIAGDLQPPLVLDVSPKLVMTGSSVAFSVEQYRDEASGWTWDFGAGAVPQYSSEEYPVVVAQAPGVYTGEVIAENDTGSFVHEFSYVVTEEGPLEPQHLYAIPDKTTVQVDEELLVTIATGQFPQSELFSSPTIGLLIDSCGEFVLGSMNLGAPGGEKYEIDGIWAEMDPPPIDFFSFFESLIAPRDSGITGIVRLDFGVTPLGIPITSSAGDIFNLRLVFREAGTYSLGFQGKFGVQRTYYNGDGHENIYWQDISNSSTPAITVLP